jgi:hypothetical protein
MLPDSPAHKFVTLHSAAFESLETITHFPCTLEGRELSKALFCDLARIKYAAWRHREKFGRGISHSLSDIFQDLLAFYLRCALDSARFKVLLEQTGKDAQGNVRPDIVIQRWSTQTADFQNTFIIEVKTTTGWARMNSVEDQQRATDRLHRVADLYKVCHENAIYVYEEPANNGEGFERRFWVKADMKKPADFNRAELPMPYRQIYPLFYGTDPVFWEKTWNHKTFVPDVPESKFIEEASRRIVTPLEEIIPLIEAAEPAAN